MKLTINYEHTEGNGQINTLPADVICWERMTKQKLGALSDSTVGMEDLAVFCWSALKRGNSTNQPFEVWIDGLLDIDVIDVDDVNPTRAEVSTDSD